jgi:hypothetical protein
MSSRSRIPVLVGAVCAAVLLAGCSSSGTVGTASSTGAAGAASGGAAGGSGGTGGTGGDSAGGADAGCTEAMLAIQNAEKAQNSSSGQAAIQGAQTSIGQLRAAANATKKPGGKYAINKVADDLQAIVTQAAQGQTPDTSLALTDAQQVASICGM